MPSSEALIHLVPPGQVARDYFCPVCAMLAFTWPRTAPDMWAVNVRRLDGVDPDVIPVRRAEGSRLA